MHPTLALVHVVHVHVGYPLGAGTQDVSQCCVDASRSQAAHMISWKWVQLACTYLKGKRGLVLVFRFPVFSLAVLTNSRLYMALLLPFKESACTCTIHVHCMINSNIYMYMNL